MSSPSIRLSVLVSVVPLLLLALGGAARAQGADLAREEHMAEQPQVADPLPLVPVVFEGFVLGPDGVPAAGAVVVSSAGGKAVTDQHGVYRLEVEAPLEAESVQVTAVAAEGGGSLTASTSVGLAARTAWVETLVLAGSATCQPSWLPTFGEYPGVHGSSGIYALAVFNDGSGPALYVGGGFATVGGVVANRIARWDGSKWSALGSGMTSFAAAVGDLAVFDDGSGPALYAAGAFHTAGGVAAENIAKWDGSSWSAVGGGLNSGVSSLTVFDDGSGPALYAGGSFTAAGGVAASRIAKWNGSSWSALGSGISSGWPAVYALAGFDDGSGPALYVGGSFTRAGAVAVNGIAKWNGSTWSAVGNGVRGGSANFPYASTLLAFDDGSGPALHATGSFDTAGDVAVKGIARWNGSTWSALGNGSDPWFIGALEVIDDGTGPALHGGGALPILGQETMKNVVKWNGSSWSPVGGGVREAGPGSGGIGALAAFDDGTGLAIYAAGSFFTAGGVAAYHIAKWDGSSWSALGRGMNSWVESLNVFDDGSGPALHVGGNFGTAGGVAANRIAKWDGLSWSALGSGMNSRVLTLTGFDDGSGPMLYAGGWFTTAGGIAASRIARWNGSSWATLGSGMTGASAVVHALTVFDDGSGPALYAGGRFSAAGDVTTRNIAKWNGSGWSALGSGVDSVPVRTLTVFDDGNGTALYAGGDFIDPSGGAASRIAKWDGSTWSALGSGIASCVGSRCTPSVHALTVFDDGSGSALYAGGQFIIAGGLAASNIAKWNGSTWSALGSGMNGTVKVLAVFDDGSGPALYAGGEFNTAGGVAANHIAKWDGSSWSALGSGVSSYCPGSTCPPSILALAVFDHDGGMLCVGGDFYTSDSGDSFLASWGCEAGAVAAHLDIKPGACPNALNPGSDGVLAVALVGSDSFDVAEVDLSTLQLSRADGTGGSVAPLAGPPGPHSVIEDVATPFAGDACDCHALGGDGVLDLAMKFRTQDVASSLQLAGAHGAVELVLTGLLLDGSGFRASDCIRLVSPGPKAKQHLLQDSGR